MAASGAQAQNCIPGPANGIPNLPGIGSSPAAISSVVSNTLTTASTAFLLQSTAFIGSPPNPAPETQGGGVWVRGVGGQVTVKSSTNTAVAATPQGNASAVTCDQRIRQDFLGLQVGRDIARLNSNGWNLHVGVTAGYLEARGRVVGGAFSFLDPAPGVPTPVGGGGFDTLTQIPFAGVYAAATKDGFFVDGLFRTEVYNTSLNAPTVSLFNQNLSAHGYSFSGSMGYNWRVPNSDWFVEPSAGVIISTLKVDPFNYVTAGVPAGTPGFLGGDTLSGTLQVDDIKSRIGRLGLRVGTTLNAGTVIWQPFAAVSVWHEFGPNVTSNYQTCPGCVVIGVNPTILSASSSTSTFGTFGQYSLGFSAAVAGTGWLGFARVDYRSGSQLEGLSATGGVRYQFTPDPAPGGKRPTYKAAPPIVTAVNWTGLYVGGFGSALMGTGNWDYGIGSASPHVAGYSLGGEIGYNWQMGSWVVGVEADLAKTNLTGSTGCGPLGIVGFGTTPMFQMTCNASANWVATATARIGYAWERALFYVKGGGAWTNEDVVASCNLGPLNALNQAQGIITLCTNPANVFSNGFSAGRGLAGWTVGSGAEFALNHNWSAKAEFNYLGFGDRQVVATDGSILNIGLHVTEVRVGVNYRFGGGPVVAKY